MKKKSRHIEEWATASMKIRTRLTLYVAFIVITVFGASIFLSQLILPKYYLHRLSHNVSQALIAYQNGEKEMRIQEKYDIIIVKSSLKQSTNDLNTDLKQQIEANQIALNKFWVSNEVLQKVKAGKEPGRVYSQGEQKSNFIAHFKKNDQEIVMAGASMADLTGSARIINQFNLLLLTISILLIILLTAWMARRFAKPILEMKHVAEDIGRLRFKKTNIDTKDELAELAASINNMSQQLELAQTTLTKRNLDLKEFMAGLTHELKTPLALIKVYASGIADGLDDGSYLQTITKQVEKMEKIITDMLYYVKAEASSAPKETLDLTKVVQEAISEYTPAAKKQNLIIHTEFIEREVLIEAHAEKVRLVVDNLVSNAIKYASATDIYVRVNHNRFMICNHTNITDINALWQPFYVAEKSRNNHFSGTGLGLSIVKSIANQEGFMLKTDLVNKIISFQVEF